MNSKKVMAMGLAAVMLASGLAGCGGKSGEGEVDGKINITISNWPDETNPNGQKNYEEYVAQMAEKRPDVNVIPDTTGYADARTFQMKAAANQLPTTIQTHFTEIQKTIDSGYAADITKVMKERGYYDAINPQVLELLKGKDGNLYCFPTNAYLQGLTLNKDLFTKAGLVNADGSIKIPNTYQELAEYAQIIKQKTGVAGYAICTTNNCGGWHFMNIAWSFGVNFVKQREDGTWEATFNTPEAVEALQYVKDLKWKYDCLPDDSVINQNDLHKLFGVNQAAIIFEGPSNDYTAKYGMDPANLVFGKMPQGPAGRYVQMGGAVRMFEPNITEDELNACIDWLEITGFSLNLDDATIENMKKGYQNTLDTKGIVVAKSAIPLWVNPERLDKEIEAKAEYVNVPVEQCENYWDTSDCIIRPEEPVLCQQMYAVLDGCIQEVLVNKDADCAALIATACQDFQENHLDKEV